MSAPGSQLMRDIRLVGHSVAPSEVSTTKWRPLADVVAEALRRPPGDVYATTVSKPGNLGVRFVQSEAALMAPIVAVIYTGLPGELNRCIEAAIRRQSSRPRDLILFFQPSSGWQLAAVVKPRAVPLPAVIAGAGPSAVIDS
jgi:hypothetical protein